MGTYNLDVVEIAEAMEEAELESFCEGDFYEETFILGAIEYIRRLRKQGAFIYTHKKKQIMKFVKDMEE